MKEQNREKDVYQEATSFGAMTNRDLEPIWPVKAGHEQDLYFYQEAIQSYLPDNRVRVVGHGEMVMLGRYSYLGLIGHPRVNEAAQIAVRRFGTGGHGARLLAGTTECHRLLEEKIAHFKGAEAAAVYSSGFITNVSTIAALIDRHSAVIIDRLVHASIVDGCLLAQARPLRYRHNDVGHLEELLRGSTRASRRLVIVDAVYSMDGDIADLPEISRLCRRYGAWLMVDEAHSLGVLGETGHGIEEHFGLPPDAIDIKMGTLSKAIPSTGGYIAGSRRLIDFLNHQSRGFIYSGALSPVQAEAARDGLASISTLPGSHNKTTRRGQE
jgi:7-keto-8-aminopelargonate synthetase-like enzyme